MTEKKRRLIFHCDCNNFFASCECLDHPELRDVPLAVAGDPEDRLGVVVAKNEIAKKFGVRTTDTVWQAKRKCKDLVFVPPRHHLYKEISEKVNDIYHEYTEYVEPASIDESYLDMTGAPRYYGITARELADTLRDRVRTEIGITISVGVSYNKIFAKMGSDLHKHRGFDVITEENYKEKMWPLPIEDLFYVGRRTAPKLRARGIGTIGDLATCRKAYIKSFLGKFGEYLWYFANGNDISGVNPLYDTIKSVGNGITTCKDMKTREDVVLVYTILCESIATRLKEQGLKGDVIKISLRDTDLRYFSRQHKIERATNVSREILKEVMHLVDTSFDYSHSLRSINACVAGLKEDHGFEQLSLFDDLHEHDVNKKIDETIDAIREKYGMNSVCRLNTLYDQELADFDPYSENIIHPVGYFR